MRYKKKKVYRFWHLAMTLIVAGFIFACMTIAGNLVTNHLQAMQPIDTTTIPTTLNDQAILLATKEKLQEANVYIQVNFTGGYEFGSGVIIHSDENYYYVITNEHILDGNNQVINSKSIVTFDSIASDFQIIAQDSEKDLALIKFDKANRATIQPINTVDNVINIDKMIVAIGNPNGNIGTITFGSINQMTTLRELEIERLAIEHDAPLYNGSSGGALVDIYGNLVGINSWELNGLYYAIPITVINTFIQNNI